MGISRLSSGLRALLLPTQSGHVWLPAGLRLTSRARDISPKKRLTIVRLEGSVGWLRRLFDEVFVKIELFKSTMIE